MPTYVLFIYDTSTSSLLYCHEVNDSSGSVFYLFRVSVAQHNVGSFNVRMDILILMDVLQYTHLQVKHKTMCQWPLPTGQQKLWYLHATLHIYMMWVNMKK